MGVKEIRKRIQVNLETYINQEKPLMRGRFGELLLLMPPLQNIARLMVDLVARYNQDTKQVDDLINEMLLSKFERDSFVFSNRRKHLGRECHNISSSISSDRYRDDCQESVISTTTKTINLTSTTTSSSPSNSSKNNYLLNIINNVYVLTHEK